MYIYIYIYIYMQHMYITYIIKAQNFVHIQVIHA